MADARITQPSFSAGEVSEDVYGRKDLARYQVALRKLQNGIVHATGGVSNRSGLYFAAEVPDSAKGARLTVFEAASDDAYLLVWGDNVARPMSFGQYVDDGGSPYEIVTPYGDDQLADMYQEQSNDVATIAHPLFPPYELARYDTTDWRMTVVDFASDVPPPEGLTAVGTEGYTGYAADKLPMFYTYAVSTIATSGEESIPSADVVSDIDLVLGYDANYVTISWEPQGASYYGMSTPGTLVNFSTARTRYVLANQLTAGDTVTHVGVWWNYATSGMAVKIAERVIAGEFTTVVDQSFNHPGGGWHDVELTSPHVVSGVGDFYFGCYAPVPPGDHTKGSSVSRASASGNVTGVATGFSEGTDYTPAMRSTIASTGETPVDGYNVYKESNGIFGLIGNTPDATFVDRNIAPSFATGPQTGRNPFVGDGNYPAVVTFSQQRRAFAQTINQPQTLFMTQAGNYKNMSTSTPTRDDDAIEITLAARKRQDIYHMIPISAGMIVFTRSGEWKVAGRSDDILTPSSILPEPQTEHGSARYLRPLVIGEQLLFVPKSLRGCLEMEYSIQVDRYKANDLTVLSRHLFEGREIIAWDYAKEPDGVVYCILDNGKGVTLTYLKDHEVWGWGRFETRGKFLDVAVVPEGGRDVPYFIVQRRVQGTYRKYIEFLADRSWTDIRDAFFVDCGISLDNPVAVDGVISGVTTTIQRVAHGLVDGDLVELSDVVMYDVNDDEYRRIDGKWIVKSATADAFRISYEYDNENANPPLEAGDDVDTTDCADCYYDGGGVFRKCFDTVIGLEHIVGRECVALADGSVVEGIVPFDLGGGSIGWQFEQRHARVHVGLSYRSVFGTLDLLNPQGDDTGIVKGEPSAWLRTRRTRGIKVGRTEEDATEEWTSRDTENYGEPASMKFGVDKVELWTDWSLNQPLYIVQDYPLPVTLLGVTLETEYGGS